MRKKFTRVLFPVFILMIAAIFTSQLNSAPQKDSAFGDADLKINYGSKYSITILTTSDKNFSDLAGKTGQWENTDLYKSYIWNDGEAAFIKTGIKKKDLLVRIVLNKNFKTSRGIKKGSKLSDVVKAYSDNFEQTEGGTGIWYVYKWDSTSKSPLLKDKVFSISFYIIDDTVDSIMLKLDSKETDEIPLG